MAHFATLDATAASAWDANLVYRVEARCSLGWMADHILLGRTGLASCADTACSRLTSRSVEAGVSLPWTLVFLSCTPLPAPN